MDSRDGVQFFLGIVIGAAIGAVTALLFAPASGEETRRKLQEKGVELKSQIEKATEEARGQAEYFQERGRIVLSEGVEKAQSVVQDVQAKLTKAADEAKAS